MTPALDSPDRRLPRRHDPMCWAALFSAVGLAILLCLMAWALVAQSRMSDRVYPARDGNCVARLTQDP